MKGTGLFCQEISFVGFTPVKIGVFSIILNFTLTPYDLICGFGVS